MKLKSNNTSGYPGLTFSKRDNTWNARIWFGGRKINLGTFKTKDEALFARKKAEEDYADEIKAAHILRYEKRSKYHTPEDRRLARLEQGRRCWWKHREKQLERTRRYRQENAEKIKAQYKTYRETNYEQIRERRSMARHQLNYLLSQVKHNAKKRGIGFSLTQSDITIPQYCEVCGRKIATCIGVRAAAPDSVSFDRLDPLGDYEPSNVKIICWECNRLKSNCRDPFVFLRIFNYMIRNRSSIKPIGLGTGLGSYYSHEFPKLPVHIS